MMHVRLVVSALLAGAACTTPDYKFAPDDAATTVVIVVPAEAGPSPDAEAAPPDAAPLEGFPIAIPTTGDFADDCAAATIPSANVQLVVGPSDGTRRCTIFFFNNPWGRSYADAKASCAELTHGAKVGALASFRGQDKADRVKAQFPKNMSPWIGLEVPPGADALDRQQWTWVSGEAYGYDGFRSGAPAGASCAHWISPQPPEANPKAEWEDLDCATTKGFLCEVDE
ncbi:MAG: C-type lectin domain-containing protein [Labilithrix sp.]|nr:C-type lectin domain-containing protein [Labilithrix sp.]MCW5809705.1 C-type lectin domain-containing protein [Labilithrix sp.]